MDSSPRYRPEIDGLRGISILAVVLFHARVPGFAGGFAGVDVFFVISGFLISRILLEELAAHGRIDLAAFYARRVRRLLPALLLVVTAVLALASLVLSAGGERQDLSKSAAATVGFVANIYFWREQASYFSGPAEWLPLLNMWTLSVEEQFYALWPALLLFAGLIARRQSLRLDASVALLLGFLLLASIATVYVFVAGKPVATFYLLPTRLWELTLGGGMALAVPWLARLRPLAGAIGLAGLAAIALAVMAPAHALPFIVRVPIAAVGATMVLAAFAARETSLAGRLLSFGTLVGAGRLSYSWYLWHWPLLALARVHDFGHADRARDLGMVALALVLAALTYRFVENPIRRGRPWPFASAQQALAAGLALSFAVCLVAVTLDLRADAAMRRDPWLASIHDARTSLVRMPATCPLAQRFIGLLPARDCTIGVSGAPPRVLLWGDSHAEHLVTAIDGDAARAGYAVLGRIKDGCPPVFHGAADVYRCRAFNAAVAEAIPALAEAGLRGIVLASRSFGFDPRGDPKTWRQNLERVLALARRHRLRVLVIAPVPTWRFDVPHCLMHRRVEDCGQDRAEIDLRRGPLVAELAAVVAGADNVRLWDPIGLFCHGGHCAPVQGGTILYMDWSHLTIAGSRLLGVALAPQLDWLAQEDHSAR